MIESRVCCPLCGKSIVPVKVNVFKHLYRHPELTDRQRSVLREQMMAPEPRDRVPYPDDGPTAPIGASRPRDPLAELVRTHRVRVGREISKLKKVERNLRRRAAAAEHMAARVLAARRTKEKELVRFERDVQGVSP